MATQACCPSTVPPFTPSTSYTPKGKYETISGFKTYVTGSSTSKNAILVVYDIFGFFPQTIQGADFLSGLGKEGDEGGYQVFMPDFFEGTPADIAWYPPETEEQKKPLYEWYSTRTPDKSVPKIPKLLEDIEAIYGKKNWAGLGFCWGGKVISLLSSSSNVPFKVAAECHPGLIATSDAQLISIPMMILASKEEDEEEVREFEKGLTKEGGGKGGEKHIETFENMIHGWMSARGDLEDEEVRKDWVRGYTLVGEWFGKFIDV